MTTFRTIVTALVFAGAVFAQAATPGRTYQELMAEGQRLFDGKKWEEAIVYYREAAGGTLDLKRAARAQYRMAQAYEEMHDLCAALLWYRTSLQHAYYSETEEAIKRIGSERFQHVLPSAEIVSCLGLPPERSVGVSPSLDLPVHFDFDRDTLNADGAQQVAELAEALANQMFASDRFVLTGHTDQHGSDAYNLDLSERRARRVLEVLCAKYGFNRGRFDVKGMGKRAPIATQDTEEAGALNRRVEVDRLRGTVLSGNYALVVGVGKFPYFTRDGKPAMDLDGPRPDAERMVEALVRRGYPRSNITMLVDVDATRDAILGALDLLAVRVKEGDHVVIYYSGHGTSSFDMKTGGFGMDPATGAIVPSDLRPGGRESTLTQLIIGNRDLRPRLSRLEAKADVLVIFDACFSGESVKSIEAAEMPPAKYVSLADLTDGEVSRKSLEQAERSMHTRSQSPDYPYRRVVYLAASANNQYARDINRHFLEHAQGRFSTYDGQPHGAFTNALLFLLADNGAVSPPCRILFQRAATMVRELAKLIGSAQDPQLLYSPTNPDEVEAPCLFTSSTATSTPTTRMGGLHR